MRISDQLRRRVIAWVVMNCADIGGVYEAQIDTVAGALELDARLFRDWVNVCAGDTLAVTEGKILVSVLAVGPESMRVKHPRCLGNGCSECFFGAVTWRYAPGELQRFKVAS